MSCNSSSMVSISLIIKENHTPRQWGFRQLEAFLIEKGNQDLSAQLIREQYILKQRELGVDLFSIARELGLKTMVTLEKYK